ncbi:hypothetical protein F1C76_20355 [Geodermatophilaceae bacterium NBWT11]|nr:hypothetical protein F1C76_20355 [Geodermatophilaceae bacterium NBWT11]
MTAVALVPPPPTRHRVPVEHRFLGLDRRTIPLAAVALVVWLLWAVVLPWIDSRIAYTDEIEAGDVLQVDQTVTFVPAAGWELIQGLRTTDETTSGDTFTQATEVSAVGVAIAAQPGPWTGTDTELLGQITDIPAAGIDTQGLRLAGDPVTVTTDSGQQGVAQGYVTPRTSGIAVAFVYEEGGDSRGLVVNVIGPPAQLTDHAQEVADMIESFTFEDAA